MNAIVSDIGSGQNPADKNMLAIRDDHHKVSFTAKLVALGRKHTSIPFAALVSDLIGAHDIVTTMTPDIAREPNDELAGLPNYMVPMLEARYLSLVTAIKRSGVKQVIEFASGVSLRGLAMTMQMPGLTYIETDLPELTGEKLKVIDKVLAREGLAKPKRHFVEVANIVAWNEIEAVLGHLNPKEPVAIVHEGLFMYLSSAEKTIAAKHIAKILDRFGGFWATPDFTPISTMNQLNGVVGDELTKMMSSIENHTARSFSAYSFPSEADAITFCEDLGFTVKEYPQIDGSFQLTPYGKEGERGPTIAALTETLKLWEMRRRS